MQFKNPEILYFLIFLIIPILVHLFQLQKFKKVAFTNVVFLKKISQQTRKSSRLKKWLILASRMLLFFSLILAFTQPYFPSEKSQTKEGETLIYLDNSISLNSKGEKGNLLQVFSNEILENMNSNSKISLATNDDVFMNFDKKRLNPTLKNVKYSSNRKGLKELSLENEIQSVYKTKTLDKIILISDFQNYNTDEFTDVNNDYLLISDQPQSKNNISIDSLLLKEQTSSSVTLQIHTTNHGNKNQILPFSIFINKELSNKQSVSIPKKASTFFEFSFQKAPEVLGEIRLDFRDSFLHDNLFFFTLDFRKKIKVLSIGKSAGYLSRIFSSDEFSFSSTSLSNVNYNDITNQQFIILNELETISNSLNNTLAKFVNEGGSLLIIPAVNPDMKSYNQFFSPLGVKNIRNSVLDSLQITKIAFDHPIFSDVFSKRVQNFEYPTVYQRFTPSLSGNPILYYANQSPFLEQINMSNGKIFWFSAPINPENSNFTRSPLIVPTLYNLAFQSISLTKPYYFAGSNFDITVPTQLNQDEVLKISKDQNEFIPLQQSKFNSVKLSLNKSFTKSGFYAVTRNNDTLQHIAINYHPVESTHDYLNIQTLAKENDQIEIKDSVRELFEDFEEKNKELNLWKLFLVLAIVSLCFEILILKFFKT